MMLERTINKFFGIALSACTLNFAFTSGLEAHEGQSERIERLDRQIEAQPTDPLLHFQRAQMHRVCRHWKLAERDYFRASELDPDLAVIDLARATVWNDASNADKALETRLTNDLTPEDI